MLRKNHNKNKAIKGRIPFVLGMLALAAVMVLSYNASLAALPSASPDLPQQNPEGTIAFVNQAQERDEIWLIEPDGSGSRRLWTPGPVDEGAGTRITGLSWRPDSGSLAFASDHEWLCSWYNSDIYTIISNGSGLRRVTNGPDCSSLANYPKGTVTVTIENATFNSGVFGVYLQGSPAVQTISLSPFGSGMLTFTDVADLGDVVQPAVVIYGGYRWIGAAYANVQPGQTVHAGTLTIFGEGFWGLGAYKSSWRQDGSGIGYTHTYCGTMYNISPNAPPGHIGQPVLNNEEAASCVMAWGPTPATANQILYFMDTWEDEQDGVYLANSGSSTLGTRIIPMESFYGERVLDIKWLPDGSGFLFTKQHVDLGIMSDIFEYNLTSGSISQITSFEDEEYAVNFSISPDGQQIVFEFRLEYDGPTDLYVIDRDGSNMRLLVPNAGHPTWSSGALQEPVFTQLFIPVLLRQP
jgi:hypothetical protein